MNVDRWALGVVISAGACGGSSDDGGGVAQTSDVSDADGDDGTSGPATGSDGIDGPGSETAGSEGESGTGSPAPTLQACMEETAIALDCGPDSRFQYVAFGETLGCGGLASFTSDEVLQFVYRTEEMIEDDYPIRELRISSPTEDGDHFVAVTDPFVLLWSFPTASSGWVGEVHALPAGIFDVTGAQVDFTIAPVPTAEDFELGNEPTINGSFTLTGGAITNIGDPVDDPTVTVVGCFAAPAEPLAE